MVWMWFGDHCVEFTGPVSTDCWCQAKAVADQTVRWARRVEQQHRGVFVFLKRWEAGALIFQKVPSCQCISHGGETDGTATDPTAA